MKINTGKVSLLDMPELAALIAATPVVKHAAGETLFQSGESCTSLPVVISGNAWIHARDKTGLQVALYRLEPGDACPISLSALLQHSTYPTTATAENNVQVRYLSGEKLQAVINSTPEVFRAFLDTFASGLYDAVRTTRQLMHGDPPDDPDSTSTVRAVHG
ncbi:MAG: hypothetical protein BMS9Abin09_0886 [Gammaproteobacteria bacterium]|nr:MAG: hypothetical protein BMS9Abin09_0886 [Gammaproteobacteria bacterium]